jgi:hypothetical protein
MRQLAIILLSAVCFNCSNAEQSNDQTNNLKPADSSIYKKSDLQKIKWIEGKWRGMYKGQPFYEIYKMINDSILEVISFEWNGKDSSKTSRDLLYWKDGSYYLGEGETYKVIAISDKEISMKRNIKTSNDVLWRYNNDTSWIAELAQAGGVTKYDMIKFDPWAGK